MRSYTLRSFVPSVLVLLVLAAPVALAQQTTSSLEITGINPELGNILANQSAATGVTVVYTVSNVVCPANTPVTVTLTAEAPGAPDFVTVTVEPAEIEFVVSQGPHGSPPAGQPYSDEMTATVTVAVAEITQNATINVTVTASAPAVQGCAPGAIPAASAPAVMTSASVTAPPPPPEPTPPPAESPGPGAIAVLVAAVVGAFVLRRRS